ncbi:MAG: hypothetical protein HY043_00515 [Verrucomicrobia bacterium]|nr:hypothetical protein [Verrucomicrobiota bacterium]
MACSFLNLRGVAPHAGEDALDFGLEAGEQRTHRIHLRRLRVQLRHETMLRRTDEIGSASSVYPNRVTAISPGLRGTSYPGKSAKCFSNPNGVVAIGA